MDDVLFSPITEQAALVRSGQLSPVELTRAYLDRTAWHRRRPALP